jgi:ATP-dependent DNA ligase
VLEGELLVYDEELEKIEPYGGIIHFRFGNQRKSHRHLYIVFYDILALNDQVFLHAPYDYRRNILEQIIKPIPGYVRLN